MTKAVTFDELNSFLQEEYEPWLSNRWRVVEMPTINNFRLSALVVETLNLPMLGYEARTKHYGSSSMSFVGGQQIDGFSMTLLLDDGWNSVKYITDWFATMQNPNTGGFYLPSYYMKDIKVAIFNNKGEQIVTSTISNVWPLTIGAPELNPQSNKTTVNVEFKCFWQTLKW